MTLVLHEMYSFDDAITSLGNDTLPEFFCRHNFAVTPKAIFCLVTLGEPETEACLQSPSCLIWKHPECRTWLPGKVTEVWDRSEPKAKKIKDYHIFLRSHEEDDFCYAGPAHLGSYGGKDYAANFYLDDKLPRDRWMQYGGYPGWLVEVNHKAHRIGSDDQHFFRQLIQTMPDQDFSHLCMTRYEEDSLTLHTNSSRGWLMYLREPADSGLYTRDMKYSGELDKQELFRCGCGIDLEFPTCTTLPRDFALEIASDFFVTGKLPENVPWVTDPLALQ